MYEAAKAAVLKQKRAVSISIMNLYQLYLMFVALYVFVASVYLCFWVYLNSLIISWQCCELIVIVSVVLFAHVSFFTRTK